MTNRIKELRKAKGYRQEDLAAVLGVSRQTIIAVENNKYNPTLELAMKLAVRGMMPRNTITKDSLSRLHICRGAEHKYAAQKPEPWTMD